jgi:hypothetical protein
MADARSRSREHGLVLLVALAAPLLLLGLGLFLEPDARGWGTHEQLGFRPCWPMRQWNLPCPGCGVTTAVTLAAHGRPLASLRTQPFGLVLLAAALAAAVWALVGHGRGRDLWAELPGLRWKAFGMGLALLALLAWLYKLARVQGALG